MDKLSFTERDICTKFILPAVKRAGWDEMGELTQNIRSQSNADGQASKW